MAGPEIDAGAPATSPARRARIRERLGDAGLAALVTTALPDIRYLSGFSGSSAVLLVFREPPDLLITDSRYDPQARDEAGEGVDVEIASDPALQAARERLAGRGVGKAAFESEHLSVAAWEGWRDAGGPALEGVKGWVEELRAVKSAAEIDAIRRAAEIADRALADVLETIRPGVTERELAAELERRMASHGAEDRAFETIAAFGERAALPHARPGARVLERGDLVLLDFGAVVDGYRSDITRTVACGDPGAEMREVYEVVRDAQAAAIEGLRAGLGGKAADALARDPIEAAGYGERFGHSLGHGIGLEVHERPRLSKKSEDTLAASMVVTVEPGVYIPGSGGVRIEDDVVLGAEGVEILTRAPKDELIAL